MRLRPPSPLVSTALVLVELIPDDRPDVRVTFNLGSGPHTEFQNPLEFLWRIVPPVVIAELMCRKVVLDCVSTTATVCHYVVGLPPR